MYYFLKANVCVNLPIHHDNKNDIKAPPALKEDVPYENWKKEINIWQLFTTLEKKKQGLAIFLSLEGKAREGVGCRRNK